MEFGLNCLTYSNHDNRGDFVFVGSSNLHGSGLFSKAAMAEKTIRLNFSGMVLKNRPLSKYSIRLTNSLVLDFTTHSLQGRTPFNPLSKVNHSENPNMVLVASLSLMTMLLFFLC